MDEENVFGCGGKRAPDRPRPSWPLILAGHLLLALLMLQPGAARAGSGPDNGYCDADVSLDFQTVPHDVCSSQRPDQFAAMAWRTFKMLVWPASAERGQADESRPLTNVDGVTPRAFETYKSSLETFPDPPPANSSGFLGWHDYPRATPACANVQSLAPGSLVLASLSKFGEIAVPDLPDLHALIAQNRSFVYYVAAFDKNEFELIRKNALYKPANIPTPGRTAPTAAMQNLTEAITIKSAWITATGSRNDPDPGKFYHREAWVQTPGTTTCERKTAFLVALHIVHKTRSNPQWIWASFEHVNNVPPAASPTAANRPAAQGGPHRARKTCPSPGRPAHDPTASPWVFNDGTGTPMADAPPDNTLIRCLRPGQPPPPPFNVERRRPLARFVEEANRAWHDKLAAAGSVWANYRLVMVQWPEFASDPDGDALAVAQTPPCGTEPKSNLWDSVMETFLQDHPESHNLCGDETLCMVCHNEARTSDFVWSLARRKPPAGAASSLSVLGRILQLGDR